MQGGAQDCNANGMMNIRSSFMYAAKRLILVFLRGKVKAGGLEGERRGPKEEEAEVQRREREPRTPVNDTRRWTPHL